jgi:SAM-dependent methyltransferase
MADRTAWQGHAGVTLDMVNEFSVIDCDGCRFKHIVPIPTPAELEHVYGHEYYSTEKPLYIQRAIEDLDWWNAVYADRYAQFERLLGSNRRRLLDVGSGPGFFLRLGRERGWRVHGIEPSSQAAAHGRGLGLDITQAFLSDDTAPLLGHFDVVHMENVLEHIPEPRHLLLTMHRLIDPGGLVAIVVPNDYNPIQDALRRARGFSPWWVAPPHHINYFDVDTIRRLVAERFDVESVETTFPIDMFLLMGDDYVGNDAVGRVCHTKRKNLELNLASAGMSEFRQRLYRGFAEAGIGRDTIVIARKPA